MPLFGTLNRFFRQEAVARPGDLVLIAFSGGPDSTALAYGLERVAPTFGLRLHAAHLDHRLDPDSSRRAAEARRLAARLGIAATVAAPPPPTGAGSLEERAREHRYRFLERLAGRLGARFIATAHHADDQAETVLLRLLFGTGLEGLRGIRRRHGAVVRPLLDLRRDELSDAVASAGLQPVDDPTNRELDRPRNAIRARLLPHLETREPEIVARLCALAVAADGAARRIERLLVPRLPISETPTGVAVSRAALLALPEPLLPHALALLHRRAGAPYPAGAAARRELERQIRSASAVGCDCGRGWRWESAANRVQLVRIASSVGDFSYTLSVPGVVDVPELDLRFRLTRGRSAPWMFRGRADRAGLCGLDPDRQRMVVRNRRPGDRIQPLGSRERQRLKNLLISQRVPRGERDRLPLLVVDDRIAWVPGVTIDERFRIEEGAPVWIASLEPRRFDIENPSPLRRQPADGDSRER